MREIVVTLVGAGILAIIGWAWRIHQNRKDRKAAYYFLRSDPQYRFRSTEAIIAATGIPANRIEALSKSRKYKYRRSSGEKDAWTAEE